MEMEWSCRMNCRPGAFVASDCRLRASDQRKDEQTRKIRKSTLAIMAAVPAMTPKPRAPATIAMIRKRTV